MSVLALPTIWFFGLWILERATVVVHYVAGGAVSRVEWLAAMYRDLWRLPVAAAIGAALWMAWLYFIFFNNRFLPLIVSIIFGTLEHLLGAWVYVSVFASWYRLRRDRTSRLPAAR